MKMKFATLALLATAASATTITIDDKSIENVAGKFQRGAYRLERKLEQLARRADEDTRPYVRNVQMELQKAYEIDMQYSQKAAQAAMESLGGAWAQTYAALGCASDAPPYCQNPEWVVSHIDHRFQTECKCTNFPVTVTNTMECSVLGSGNVACVNM